MNSIKIILLLLLIFLSGCSTRIIGGAPATCYYLNPHKDLYTIGRVAIVELANDLSYPNVSTDVTEALFQALQKKQIFGLTIVRQSDTVWRNLQIGLNSTFNLEQLAAMHESLRCDAILVGTITGYKPYPHMAIGLRLKLIDLTDGQMLWAIEQIWDTTDKTTEERIKKYYSHSILPGSTSLEGKLGTVSSIKFVKFVVDDVGDTL